MLSVRKCNWNNTTHTYVGQCSDCTTWLRTETASTHAPRSRATTNMVILRTIVVHTSIPETVQ